MRKNGSKSDLAKSGYIYILDLVYIWELWSIALIEHLEIVFNQVGKYGFNWHLRMMI